MQPAAVQELEGLRENFVRKRGVLFYRLISITVVIFAIRFYFIAAKTHFLESKKAQAFIEKNANEMSRSGSWTAIPMGIKIIQDPVGINEGVKESIRSSLTELRTVSYKKVYKEILHKIDIYREMLFLRRKM